MPLTSHVTAVVVVVVESVRVTTAEKSLWVLIGTVMAVGVIVIDFTVVAAVPLFDPQADRTAMEAIANASRKNGRTGILNFDALLCGPTKRSVNSHPRNFNGLSPLFARARRQAIPSQDLGRIHYYPGFQKEFQIYSIDSKGAYSVARFGGRTKQIPVPVYENLL
jgi:hypothetical protein